MAAFANIPKPPWVDDQGRFYCVCGASHLRGPNHLTDKRLFRCLKCGDKYTVTRENDYRPASEALPTVQQNPDGFHQRYIVSKASGEPVDPRAVYLVLRLDCFGDDQEWLAACRIAAAALAHALPDRLAKMGREIIDTITEFDRASPLPPPGRNWHDEAEARKSEAEAVKTMERKMAAQKAAADREKFTQANNYDPGPPGQSMIAAKTAEEDAKAFRLIYEQETGRPLMAQIGPVTLVSVFSAGYVEWLEKKLGDTNERLVNTVTKALKTPAFVGDWGHLPNEPCRFCRTQGKVYFLIDDGPEGRSAAQTVRCDACGRSWEANSSSA